MEKIFKNIVRKINNLTIKIFNHISKSYGNFYIKSICESLEKNSDYFYSYIVRAKNANKIMTYPLNTKKEPKIAIILQGPIHREYNYTIETIKLYKKSYSNAVIIVSTWDDIDKVDLDKIKDLNVEVVTSDKPKFTGIGNINFQIRSTKAGLEKAKELGCDYAIKTRTDQRYEKNNLIEFLFSLKDEFKIGNDFEYLKQKERIIVAQGTSKSNMFIPYFISDFFYFGTVDDLIKLFDYDEMMVSETKADRQKIGNELKHRQSIMEYIEGRAPEIMIIKNYISEKGKRKIENSVKDYWKFVKSNLITLSHDEVGFFWAKYERRFMENNCNFKYFDDGKLESRYTWNFSNWLSLYKGYIEYDSKYEEYHQKKADII